MKEIRPSLEKKLDYHFKDASLLNSALSHRSVGSDNNERLEYLGDAILGFIIAGALFDQFPKATEGELSRLRATLVRGVTLAAVARGLNLSDYLNLGPGELKSGGGRRESILAGTVEAIIGAVYIDAGIDSASKLVLKLFRDRLTEITPKTVEKDPKTRLQELLQSRGKTLPLYKTLQVFGVEHEQSFKVSCEVDMLERPVEGVGSSRRGAEQAAAQEALLILSERKNNL